MNIADVDLSTGLVLNMLLFEGVQPAEGTTFSSPLTPAGHHFVATTAGAIGWTWNGSLFEAPVVPLATRQADMCAGIDMKLAAVLAASASYTVGGTTYHGVQVDDVSQGRIAAMAQTAALVKLTYLSTWPTTYQGWLLADNTTLIPLATPDAGIAFAAAISDWVATAIVNSHALKAAVRASSTPESVDITTGWPAA